MVSLEFFGPHYGPGFDLTSNRNEYQEYFMGLWQSVRMSDQPYHLHVPIVFKSEILNLLEP